MGNETRNLWLSIGAALFAVFLIYSYSQEKKKELDKNLGAKKTIVRAKEDIPEMSTVYDTMLETVEIPANYVYPDTVSVPDEIIGHVAAVPVKKGQLILKNMLFTPGPDTGISLQVAPNKRAVTIPVDEIRGVAKLIRPGDRVDIVATIDSGKGQNQRREATVLMQDVPILATGVSVVNNIPRLMELDSSGKNVTQTSLTGDTKYSTITIEASPKEAQDLIYLLATSPGNLFFTLRNPNDRMNNLRIPSSTAESLLGQPTGFAPPAAGAPTGFPTTPGVMPQAIPGRGNPKVVKPGFKSL
jgi:pilus assembly protein CpaB